MSFTILTHIAVNAPERQGQGNRIWHLRIVRTISKAVFIQSGNGIARSMTGRQSLELFAYSFQAYNSRIEPHRPEQLSNAMAPERQVRPAGPGRQL